MEENEAFKKAEDIENEVPIKGSEAEADVKEAEDASQEEGCGQTEAEGAGEAEKNTDPDKEGAEQENQEDGTERENQKDDLRTDAEIEGAGGSRKADEPEDGKKDRMSHREKKVQKELEKKDEQIADLQDRYRRSIAEFDNYRKRTEKEKSGMYQMGVRDVLEKVLPVLDNFERGFSQIQEEDKQDPFTTGMEKVYKQFQQVLTDIGIEPIDAKGKEFDPNFHNAVMHVEDDSVGENIVVEELQKGYTYKDAVVRHSMVKVAN